jgi:hypothetical protein
VRSGFAHDADTGGRGLAAVHLGAALAVTEYDLTTVPGIRADALQEARKKLAEAREELARALAATG